MTKNATTQCEARPVGKRSEVIARKIVHDIVLRALPMGAKLPPEAIMVKELGVARATLREALRLLETQGVITIRPGPGGGPVVAGASSLAFGKTATMFFQMRGATFRELNDARLMLEPLMARLAAQQHDTEALDRLMSSIDNGRQSIVGDDEAWAQSSADFHGVVTSMSGNRILDLVVESMKALWFDRVAGTIYDAEARERVRCDHEAIAAAIASGDSELAERLMRTHMEEFTAEVSAKYPGLMDEVVDWR